MNGEPPQAVSGGWLRPPVVVGVALGLIAMAASTFTTLGLGALAPYLRADFHLSTFEIGLFPALVFAGAFAVSVPAGHLTDRLGAGWALVLSQLGVAAGMGVAALAPNSAVFLTGVGLAGLGYGAVNPATNVLSTSLVPRRRRALFLSVKQTGVPLGGLMAGAVLPSLADALGWREALGLAIGLLICSALAGTWVARRERAGWFDMPRPAPEAPAARNVRVRVPGGVPTAVFGFVMSGVQLSVTGYLTVYLVDTQSFSRPAAGVALSVAFAAACVGRVAWGWLSDRFFDSHATTLVLTSAGSLLALVAISAGVSGPLLWVVIASAGICAIGWNGVYMALITDRSAGRRLGHATGRGLMFLYGGVVVLPPLFGALHDSIGSWTTMWSIATGAVLLAAAVLALSPRHPGRADEAGRPQQLAREIA